MSESSCKRGDSSNVFSRSTVVVLDASDTCDVNGDLPELSVGVLLTVTWPATAD